MQLGMIGLGRRPSRPRIDEGVPVDVLAAALFERFTSRGQADFQNSLLSAMRSSSAAMSEENPAHGTACPTRSCSSAPPGDLAYKKIFPALQAMIRRGHLDVPVIGVAKSGWTLEQLRERARATA